MERCFSADEASTGFVSFFEALLAEKGDQFERVYKKDATLRVKVFSSHLVFAIRI